MPTPYRKKPQQVKLPFKPEGANKALLYDVSSRDRVASISRVSPRSSPLNDTPHSTPLSTMNSAFRITDSTDWIGTSLPVFEALEASLRCQVCKEFYDTPTITACSHTFCSLCIRKSISNDGKCPTCRSSQQADKLRVNWVVGDVVEKFKDARPMALEMARKDKEIKEQGMRSSSKRKIEDTDLESEGSQRETRARRTRNRNQTTTSSQNDVIEVPDSEEEGDEELEPLPDGMARCPICDEAMKEAAVFSHLDRCPGEQKSVSGRSTRSRYIL